MDVEVQPAPEAADPAALPRGVAHHQGEGGNRFGHHRPGADQAVFAKRTTADNGRIGPYAGSFADQSGAEFGFSFQKAARVDHVRKHRRRSDEHVILANHAGVQRHVVLHFHAVAQPNAGSDHDVLAQDTALSQDATGHEVAKMPNLGSGANLATCVHNGGRMGEKRHFRLRVYRNF